MNPNIVESNNGGVITREFFKPGLHKNWMNRIKTQILIGGELQMEQFYINGRMYLQKEYIRGKIYTKNFYVPGSDIQPVFRYDRLERLAARWFCKNGKIEGTAVEYRPNGNPSYIYNYKNNRLHGEHRDIMAKGVCDRYTNFHRGREMIPSRL